MFFKQERNRARPEDPVSRAADIFRELEQARKALLKNKQEWLQEKTYLATHKAHCEQKQEFYRASAKRSPEKEELNNRVKLYQDEVTRTVMALRMCEKKIKEIDRLITKVDKQLRP